MDKSGGLCYLPRLVPEGPFRIGNPAIRAGTDRSTGGSDFRPRQ